MKRPSADRSSISHRATSASSNLPTAFAPDLASLHEAAAVVYQHLQPTPQLEWPLLNQRCGRRVLVKHENHNPTGAFKVRGGLVYLQRLVATNPDITGVVTATRGNHGQSIAYAARKLGLRVRIVVPEDNNPDKNRAMAALGAEVIIHGRDFDEAVPHAQALADDSGDHRIPSFHTDLVMGVASYALELFDATPDLARVYVPIGLGSGICGTLAARNALALDAEIIGVVAEGADAYARSLESGECQPTERAETHADGVAVRTPSPDALAMMLGNVDRILRVPEEATARAMGYLFTDTHNVAEGAGAIALAGLLEDPPPTGDRPSAVILSGGNAVGEDFASVLNYLYPHSPQKDSLWPA